MGLAEADAIEHRVLKSAKPKLRLLMGVVRKDLNIKCDENHNAILRCAQNATNFIKGPVSMPSPCGSEEKQLPPKLMCVLTKGLVVKVRTSPNAILFIFTQLL